MAEAVDGGAGGVKRDPRFLGADDEDIDPSTGAPKYRTKPISAAKGPLRDFIASRPKGRVRIEIDSADRDEINLPPARDNFVDRDQLYTSSDDDDYNGEDPDAPASSRGRNPAKKTEETFHQRVPIRVNDDGTAELCGDGSDATIGRFCVAPLIQSFNEVQVQTKDYVDKPVLRDDIRIPNRLAVKSMRVMGIADLLREKHPHLKDKKFDIAHQSFHLRCGYPNEVKWSINQMVDDAAHSEDWTMEQTADHIATRFLSPEAFFEVIKPTDYKFYQVDFEKLEVVAITQGAKSVFAHNFTDVYRCYLNRAQHDDMQHLIDRHKRLLEDRRTVNDIYNGLCRTGNVLARVNFSKRYAELRDGSVQPLVLQDIEYLPGVQMALVCEKNADYVYLNEPLPDFLAVHGPKIWDIGFENLRRLYMQKTWIKRRCIPRGDEKSAKDGVWLYFLEGYDCECLAFLASTMFMPERMREVSQLKVKGDIIMGIVRDDVTMLCGSEELWSIAYMAHVGVDAIGHEAYVGMTLRLETQPNGTLAWVFYKPRTAREAVMPQNRVEVDLFVCQMQQRMHPTGCANCHRMVSKLMVCSRCHDNFYCSKDCQKLNWKEHKVHCIKRAAAKGAITAAEKQVRSQKTEHSSSRPVVRDDEEYLDHLRDNLPKKYHKYVKSLLD